MRDIKMTEQQENQMIEEAQFEEIVEQQAEPQFFAITDQQINAILQVLDGVAKQEGFSLSTASVVLKQVVEPLTTLQHITLTITEEA